jgi:hypothetical protein
MKKISIAGLVLVAAVSLFSVGCRSTRDYPERYPNGGISKRDYPYPPVSNRRVIIVEEPRRLPPGQAKKIYGSRSARPYAPGQQKKYYKKHRYDRDRDRDRDRD